MAIKAPKIQDFDKKIDIWEKAYGNSSESKLLKMNIDKEANRFNATVQYARAIADKNYEDIEQLADTFTYLYEIESGYEKETFEDIPYIIPYLVENSKYSVILLSGGGFAYKTIHGGISGGKRAAIELNKRGINAFVLSYRANPYKFPIPMLDLQRAIRYIRFNAKKFNINPDNITSMGYSAGGYVVASYINKYMGKNNFDSSYVEDEIDKVDDSIKSASFIYSPMTFNYNVSMLFAVYDAKDVRDEEKRKNMLNELDLKQHINSYNIAQFISYSNSDSTVDYRGNEEYVKSAKKDKINITRIFVPDQEHGYGEKFYIEDYVKWLNWVYN